tara:strand:- start:283 stop:465 length:183 start_codon:yes stop_codon:yes gene_type:complete
MTLKISGNNINIKMNKYKQKKLSSTFLLERLKKIEKEHIESLSANHRAQYIRLDKENFES